MIKYFERIELCTKNHRHYFHQIKLERFGQSEVIKSNRIPRNNKIVPHLEVHLYSLRNFLSHFSDVKIDEAVKFSELMSCLNQGEVSPSINPFLRSSSHFPLKNVCLVFLSIFATCAVSILFCFSFLNLIGRFVIN